MLTQKLITQNSVFFILSAGIFFISSLAFSKSNSTNDAPNLYPDPGFSNVSADRFPLGYRFARGEGINGNNAIFYERTSPKTYKLFGRAVSGLKKETPYKFGVWVKTKDLIGKGGATICIEYANKGKSLGGTYPTGISGNKDWTLISVQTVTPADFDRARIILYLKRKCTGKAWFYSPFVRLSRPTWQASLIRPVMNFGIKAGKQELVFNSFAHGIKQTHLSAKVNFIRNGKSEKTFICPVKNNRFRVIADLLPGNYDLNLTLLNKNGKEIIQSMIAIQVLDHKKNIPRNAVHIDNNANTWSRGKKFLPVGLFTNHESRCFRKWKHRWRKTDIENLKNSPFNCIMGYDVLNWRFEGSRLKGVDAAREVMDKLNEAGIRVIVSLKDIKANTKKYGVITGKDGAECVKNAVTAFKNHPALLAWYLVDEREIKSFDIKRRVLTGKLDPFHPTWQVQHIAITYSQRMKGADVFGIDPYPIRSSRALDMNLILKTTKMAMDVFGSDGNAAIWGVPQIFSWSYYISSEKVLYPTENQMRSMSLLMAVMGVKGFIMFSYSDMLREEKNQFEKRWPKVCRVARMLRELEPFLLSDAQRPEIKLNVLKGKIKAKAFSTDDGRVKVLIASVGPENAIARLSIKNADEFKSEYGRSVLDENGTWIFKGNGIDSDILYKK